MSPFIPIAALAGALVLLTRKSPQDASNPPQATTEPVSTESAGASFGTHVAINGDTLISDGMIAHESLHASGGQDSSVSPTSTVSVMGIGTTSHVNAAVIKPIKSVAPSRRFVIAKYGVANAGITKSQEALALAEVGARDGAVW